MRFTMTSGKLLTGFCALVILLFVVTWMAWAGLVANSVSAQALVYPVQSQLKGIADAVTWLTVYESSDAKYFQHRNFVYEVFGWSDSDFIVQWIAAPGSYIWAADRINWTTAASGSANSFISSSYQNGNYYNSKHDYTSYP